MNEFLFSLLGMERSIVVVTGPVGDAMVTDKIGANNFFMSVQEAVDCHDALEVTTTTTPHQAFILQTNA